jgi:hypothetical protein
MYYLSETFFICFNKENLEKLIQIKLNEMDSLMRVRCRVNAHILFFRDQVLFERNICIHFSKENLEKQYRLN